MVCSFLKLLD
ncbi:Protein of unknown function [Bacillus wiedmannii]|uniref:Uncharacterized protein n=1 Tax=Bacillus wiedmannii TaxID=1890302 RepID=A0AB37YZG1_9BACI|nr:Protein of unknown function [Bacillus wiedmannii]